jgi:hypothetical protein
LPEELQQDLVEQIFRSSDSLIRPAMPAPIEEPLHEGLQAHIDVDEDIRHMRELLHLPAHKEEPEAPEEDELDSQPMETRDLATTASDPSIVEASALSWLKRHYMPVCFAVAAIALLIYSQHKWSEQMSSVKENAAVMQLHHKPKTSKQHH